MQRLRKIYLEQYAPSLAKSLGVANSLAVPKITKIVVNVGVGKFLKDSRVVDTIAEDLAKITGQKAVHQKAKKSIAGFKIREGQVVGLSVTLRGDRMYSFLDKLINISLPRVRDFRGIKPSFDGRGNLHVGLKEHLVFPEISQDAVEHAFGMEISMVTNAGTDDRAKQLLQLMNFPFMGAN